MKPRKLKIVDFEAEIEKLRLEFIREGFKDTLLTPLFALLSILCM